MPRSFYDESYSHFIPSAGHSHNTGSIGPQWTLLGDHGPYAHPLIPCMPEPADASARFLPGPPLQELSTSGVISAPQHQMPSMDYFNSLDKRVMLPPNAGADPGQELDLCRDLIQIGTDTPPEFDRMAPQQYVSLGGENEACKGFALQTLTKGTQCVNTEVEDQGQSYFGEDASSHTTARSSSTKRSRRAFTKPKRQKVNSVRQASACIRCQVMHEEVSLDACFPFNSD